MSAAAVQTQPPVPTGPLGQPDIAYTPNFDSYQARVKRRQETEKLDKSLPQGFPQKLVSDLVWDGRDLADKYDWNYVLTEADLKEIDDALKHFKCELQVLAYGLELSRLTGSSSQCTSWAN